MRKNNIDIKKQPEHENGIDETPSEKFETIPVYKKARNDTLNLSICKFKIIKRGI